MLACAALVVCSCQKDPKPALSFETGNYVMGADEALTVKVVTTQAPATDLTVEFTAAGSAVKGTDYAFSAESFTIKAGETVGEITVTPLNNLGANLTVNLTLTLPVGYEAGNFTSTLIAMGAKEKIAYSFEKAETKLVGEVDIVLNLVGETSGANFVAGGELTLPFVIDQTSTAAAADYEVKDGATAFVFAKGEKSAKITLVSKLESVPADDAKNIVIKLDETAIAAAYGERFTQNGVNKSITAVMTSKLMFDDLEGKWAYASAPILSGDPAIDAFTFGMLIVDAGDAEYTDEMMENFTIANFPTGTASDILEFKYADGKPSLVPSGNGSVLNYFKECEVTALAPTSYNWYNFYPAKTLNATTISLSSADVLYSATSDDLKPADVIINLSEDGNTLDVFIPTKSYVPTDFFVNSYAVMSEMWTMEGMEDFVGVYDLYFTFTRVTE